MRRSTAMCDWLSKHFINRKKQMTGTFSMRAMTRRDIDIAMTWAADEGWNPGLSDAECFVRVDPKGFWGGYLDDQLISAISVMIYDAAFAFLGLQITRPDFRGQGYGTALWKHALDRAGERCVGLDRMVDQQEPYLALGFVPAYRNIRHGGLVNDALENLSRPCFSSARITRPTPAIEALDRMAFPAPRRAFLGGWLSASGHMTRLIEQDGRLQGYGVLRSSHLGYRVGPLIAQDQEVARALLTGLLQDIAVDDRSAPVFLDTPQPNEAALKLAAEAGLAPVFETVRMYRSDPPASDLSRVFGVTSFELG